jgi:hypothetical protein
MGRTCSQDTTSWISRSSIILYEPDSKRNLADPQKNGEPKHNVITIFQKIIIHLKDLRFLCQLKLVNSFRAG